MTTPKYILIGTKPTYAESRQKKFFKSQSGRLLAAFFKQQGVDIYGDSFYLMNVINNPKISKLTEYWQPLNIKTLMQFTQPLPTIVLLGKVAKQFLFPEDTQSIKATRGWTTWGKFNVYIMTHPNYYIYNQNQVTTLVTDIKRILRGKLPEIELFSLTGKQNKYTMIDTPNKLRKLILRMKEKPVQERSFASFDIETSGLDFQRDRVLCLSISLKLGQAYIIPDTLLYGTPKPFVTTAWTKEIRTTYTNTTFYKAGLDTSPDLVISALLDELFEIPGYVWVAHNSKFDLKFLITGLKITKARCEFDTLLAHYVLDEKIYGHGLKQLGQEYFDIKDYEVLLSKYKKKSESWSKIPRKILYPYNAMDTEITLRLAYELKKELEKEKLYLCPFKEVLMRANPMLLWAEIHGMLVNWDEVDNIKHELSTAVNEKRFRLQDIIGNPELNPNSPQQVIPILFDLLHFPELTARDVKGRTSKKEVLNIWLGMKETGQLILPEDSWEFLTGLLKYRHLRKLLGSYIRKWPNYRGIDDRVHTNFKLWGTVTGRLASVDPPMQTIPSKTIDKYGPMVANIHQAPKGSCFLYADYSQAELMIAAGLSNDTFMIKAFQQKQADYHSIVATMAFGEDFTLDQRTSVKRLTFGWLYGGNVQNIALKILKFDPQIAKTFATHWEKTFQHLVKWREQQKHLIKTKGFVQSIFKRKRRQPLITRTNLHQIERMAINAPIQSAASDFTLIAATLLFEKYHATNYAKVILLIHDSIIMEVKETYAEEVAKEMERVMLSIPAKYFPLIPFQAKVKKGYRLGDLT